MNLKTDGMQFAQTSGWGAAFLPTRHQGVVVSPKTGINNLTMPAGVTEADRRQQLELIDWFHQQQLERWGPDSELKARSKSYQLAHKMQSSAPELMDWRQETPATEKLYGLDRPATEEVGAGVSVGSPHGGAWRAFHSAARGRLGRAREHSGQPQPHGRRHGPADRRPCSRTCGSEGCLDTTLVVWCGEFGRTPTMEGKGQWT